MSDCTSNVPRRNEAEGVSLESDVTRSLITSNLTPRWVRAAQLPDLFCSWDLAYRCTKSGWLEPVVRGKRRTIYRLADVLRCLERIESGEMPSPRAKKTNR